MAENQIIIEPPVKAENTRDNIASDSGPVMQCTLRTSITVSGVGLHTGILTNLTFKPAAENHGYKFQRIDLPGKPIVEADVDNVTDTDRGTTISKNGAKISTIEHVLAALAGMEIDNVLMEIDGPEVPIMDGSSSRTLAVTGFLSSRGRRNGSVSMRHPYTSTHTWSQHVYPSARSGSRGS